jgi:hypothetical protein
VADDDDDDDGRCEPSPRACGRRSAGWMPGGCVSCTERGPSRGGIGRSPRRELELVIMAHVRVWGNDVCVCVCLCDGWTDRWVGGWRREPPRGSAAARRLAFAFERREPLRSAPYCIRVLLRPRAVDGRRGRRRRQRRRRYSSIPPDGPCHICTRHARPPVPDWRRTKRLPNAACFT